MTEDAPVEQDPASVRRPRCTSVLTLVPGEATLTAAVAKACIAQGVIVLTCGTYGNVIRFLPPLTIPDPLLHEGIDVLATALAAA